MIPDNQMAPRAFGRAHTTVQDLLLDAAVSTAMEATSGGNTDEALAILDMAVELLSEPASEAKVAVLTARPKPPTNNSGQDAKILEFRRR